MLNTQRSAIVLINNRDTSGSTLINRFFKGAFKLRHTAPKYASTWDVGNVLGFNGDTRFRKAL